jgi:simple sugar transport system ATP-binding protein
MRTDGSPAGVAVQPPLLELRGVRKRFGHVEALKGVDFEVRAGEIVALVGDNGAGKSTLVKVLVGVEQPDGGEILIEGTPTKVDSPMQAKRLGVDAVFQDLSLALDLTAVDNFFLGREILRRGPLGWFGFLDKKRMRRETLAAFGEYGLKLARTDTPVGAFSGGQRQNVAVVRSVASHSKVVLMDEPTAALSLGQTRAVLQLIRTVRDAGTSVVLISHDLPHVLEVADRIQVIRLGRRVAEFKRDEADLELLVDTMTGIESENHGLNGAAR